MRAMYMLTANVLSERHPSADEACSAFGTCESAAMKSAQAAVVLGASGSVGNALIKQLIRSKAFNPVVALVRRSQREQVALTRDSGVELREMCIASMDPVSVETATADAIRALEGGAVGLSVLGVGARTAKLTLDEHRAVDVELNGAFARGLKGEAEECFLCARS